MKITNIDGLNGQEEMLALNSLEAEQDDDGCTEDEPDNFNEHDYLTDCAEGAGYSMDQDGI